MIEKVLARTQSPKIRIGCQGWNYPDWVTKADGESVFYPRGAKTSEMLEIYALIFDSIEVDSTFYAIPAAQTLESWFQKTPADFAFSLKLPQEISHRRALDSSSYELLEQFCERARLLKEKLGAILIQTPPQFAGSKENALNLRNFLQTLPRDIRFAIEFRNRDWAIDWTFRELKKAGVAFALVEGEWMPRETTFEAIARPTADFSYVRFMGDRDLESFDKVVRPQASNLKLWRDELSKLQSSEIFVTFSNFYEGYAPASANELKALFGQEIKSPALLETQVSLF